jgi:hypothetical protein
MYSNKRDRITAAVADAPADCILAGMAKEGMAVPTGCSGGISSLLRPPLRRNPG